MVPRKESIRYKLSRVILLTSTAVLLLTFTSYLIYEYFSYRQITVRQLSTLGKILGANSTAALAFDSPEDAIETLSALRAEQHIESACLYDKDGRLFSVYPSTLRAENFPEAPGRLGYRYEENYLHGFASVEEGGKKLGTLYLKRNTRDLTERLILYALIAGIVMTFAIVLAVMLSRILQKGISEPVISLARLAREVSEKHDYSVRANKTTKDEIGFLTDAFNIMLEEIEIQNTEIQQSRAKIQKHADELEVKVQERTIELQKQRDFAEAVVNSSLVLIAVFDIETRVIAFNDKCEEEFGLSRAEVLGKRFAEVFPMAVDSFTARNINESLTGKFIHADQYKSSVTGKYYESYFIPLKNQMGETYAVLMTAHDITLNIESTEKIKQSNLELMRKNSELEQFAYVASHDLQEPLRKIQTFIELAQKPSVNEETSKRYLSKIETSAFRMSSLIRDVLEYSRLSQATLITEIVDLNLIVENVKLDFELLIEEKNVSIKLNKLPVISGNKLQLHQLFANLINNSIKFSKRPPVITITAEEVNGQQVQRYHELNKEHKYVQLTFSDNGIGFEQQFADKIFTIFQRLHTRDKYEGTGIGLALCKKIIENHHGHIHATSVPDEGTTFVILLPAKEKP